MYNPELRAAIAAAEEEVNQKFRTHPYLGGEKKIQQWRGTGLLDETVPGSFGETTLAILLENQRTIQECVNV